MKRNKVIIIVLISILIILLALILVGVIGTLTHNFTIINNQTACEHLQIFINPKILWTQWVLLTVTIGMIIFLIITWNYKEKRIMNVILSIFILYIILTLATPVYKITTTQGLFSSKVIEKDKYINLYSITLFKGEPEQRINFMENLIKEM